MAGRVLRLVRNIAGYVMGDPWEGVQQGDQQHPGTSEATDNRGPAPPANSPVEGGFARRVAVPRDSQGRERGRSTGYMEAPVLTEAQGHTGGVQGFQWYAHELRRDSDGDVACAFLEESPELAGYSSRDHQSTAAGALPAGSTARKGAGAQLQSRSSKQAQRKPSSTLQVRPPLAEVPPEGLQPVGMCPILCCIDGNLTLSHGPSQEVGFA